MCIRDTLIPSGVLPRSAYPELHLLLKMPCHARPPFATLAPSAVYGEGGVMIAARVNHPVDKGESRSATTIYE
jgi:hypothetical protein